MPLWLFFAFLPSCRKKSSSDILDESEEILLEEERFPPPRTVEEPKCVIESGEVALLTRKGILDPHGRLWDPKDCRFKGSSTLRFHYNESPAEEDTMSNEAPAVPTTPSVPAVPETPEVSTDALSPEELTAEVPHSDIADVSAAADAAAKMGGDYAPLVGLALAAMAILGGGKAWAFYKERGEQKHELEMAKLKMQAQDPNMRPQPCKQAQAQLDEKLESIERKIAKLERHSFDMGDFDGDDCMRRLKKLERRLSDED